jgi:hypothetical protein
VASKKGITGNCPSRAEVPEGVTLQPIRGK